MLLASQSKNHTAQEKRKKRKKKGQNLLYNNSHISLPQSHTVILSSNPMKKEKRKKKKIQCLKIPISKRQENFWISEKNRFGNTWLSAVCLPIHAPLAVNTHTVSYLLLYLCFALKFEAFLKK
jgi:hypothetical protein